jgi:nicotinate-nucleotide pyrophosphorylase (carboxylating)
MGKSEEIAALFDQYEDFFSGFLDFAIYEDIRSGDITTLACVKRETAYAAVIARTGGILAGLPMLELVFKKIDKGVIISSKFADGNRFKPGDRVAGITGDNRAILSGERLALNCLGRLSGIATYTAEFVEKLKDTDAVILDTRKTTPGFRYFEKYAVICGGGQNHRYGLFDMFLIKDNHIKSAGSITEAVARVARFKNRKSFKNKYLEERDDPEIEVEVESLAELEEAISAGAEIIMLDNQSPRQLARLVKRARELSPEIRLEASGNISLKNVRQVAETGIDFISVGRITHSAPSVDFSLEMISSNDRG